MEIRIVAATYRSERRRLGPEDARAVRLRARSMLVALDAQTGPYPDLAAAVANLIQWLERDDRLAAGGLGEEAVESRRELVDVEGLD